MTNIETWRYKYRDNYDGARYLLANEAQGFAIDATQNGTREAVAAYTGGPVGGTVQVKDPRIGNVLIGKALDASNLTQAGTSPKMVHFPTSPYVRWTPHNLWTKSQDLDDAVYDPGTDVTVDANTAIAPDGTTTADTITATSNNAIHLLYRSNGIAAVPYRYYTVSGYFKMGTHRYMQFLVTDDSFNGLGLVIDLQTGTIENNVEVGSEFVLVDDGIVDAENGWYRVYIAFNHGNGNTEITVLPDIVPDTTDTWAVTWDADGDESIYAWGLQVNHGVTLLPYIATEASAVIGIPLGYDNAESKFGILVEPAATNVVLYSKVDNNWSVLGGTVTPDFATAPDGSMTAAEFDEGSDDNYHTVYQNAVPINLSASSGTASVYVKYVDRQYVNLEFFRQDSPFEMVYACFDLQGATVAETGSFFGGTVDDATITEVGGGWYRCTLTGTTGANANHQVRVGAMPSPGGVTEATWTGTNKTFLVWGAQLELGTVATSYIPTVGATVTRGADNIIALSSSTPYDVANTAYVSAKAREVATQHDVLMFDANNANEDESVALYTDTSANILMRIEDGGSGQLDPLDSAVNATANTTFQITGAWATNDVDVSANGTAAASDGTATMPTITHIRLGNNPTPGNSLNGFIYKVVVVPRQVETEDADLETWRYEA